MARFARIVSQIRANRVRVPELNPFLANRVSGHQKCANRRFEAIRANCLNILKTGI